MDILVYANNIEKDCQIVAVIDWQNFDQEVKQRPEDYVFILSSDEWNKFMELDRQIRAGLEGKDMQIQESEYINQYQGIIAIAALAIQPDFLKRYKIGSYPLDSLGLSHAVYFISRSADKVERTRAVLKRIKDYRTSTAREDNKRN
jgi:hypothetical protein